MGFENFVWFVGEVEDNTNDPKQIGRVRIRCFNLHDENEVAANDLPWAIVMTTAQSASANGIGTSSVGIANGSVAFGFFLDGNERNMPLVIGTYNANGDHSGLALGSQILKKDPIGPEPASAYAAKYPHNKTFTTKSGHAVEYDDTPGHERIHIYHKSGTYTEINETGRKVDKTVDDSFEIVVGNKTLYIGKDLNITVKGNVNLNVDGNVTENIQGNVDATIAGSVKWTTTSVEMDLQGGNLQVKNGDILADTVSLKNHKNTGVKQGPDLSGPPAQ